MTYIVAALVWSIVCNLVAIEALARRDSRVAELEQRVENLKRDVDWHRHRAMPPPHAGRIVSGR